MRGDVEQARRSGIMRFLRLMTVTDTRACRPIILDPVRTHPTHARRPAPGRRSRSPAGLPGHRPRPAGRAWPPPPAGRDPGHGRRRGAHRRPVGGRGRRVGLGYPPAGPGGAWRPPRGARPLLGAVRGHHPPDPGLPGRRGLGRGDRRVAGQPGGCRAVATDGRGGRQEATGLRRRRPPDAPAGGHGAHQPQGAGAT